MLASKYKSSYIIGVNKLPAEARILSLLCEGTSMRAVSLLTGYKHQHGSQDAERRGQVLR